MPKTKISEFSATPGNNTDIDGINIAEGCAPSGINDAIRELMAQLKDFQAGTAGDSFNGPVGTSTAAAGAFTTLSSTGNTTLGDASGDAVTINGATTFVNVSPTITPGTANGVAYLNGSKVLTTGSALTFDGTNFAVTGGTVTVGSTQGNAQLIYGSVYGGIQFRSNTTVQSDVVGDTSGNLYSDFLTAAIWRNSIVGTNELMRLTSTGLGIGTSSPGYKLHVNGTSATIALTASNFSASSTSTVLFRNVDGNGNTYNIASIDGASAGNGGYGNLVFSTAFNTTNTERMRLDSSGNLGIGTTSPGSKLDVSSTTDGDTVRISFPSAATGTTGGGLQFRAWTNSAVLVEQSRIQSICTDGSASYAADMRFMTANAGSLSEKMRLNSAGNLGLGVTPSAWSAGRTTLQINGTTQPNIQFTGNPTNGGAIWTNSFFDGTSPKYVATGAASIFATSNGGFQWQIAPSGTAGNAISFTQAMTLDSSGRLLVGTTSAAGNAGLQVKGASSGYGRFDGTSSVLFAGDAGSLISGAAAADSAIRAEGALLFASGGGTERARITSGGDLLVGTTTANARLTLQQSGSQDVIRVNIGTGGSGYVVIGSGTTMGAAYFQTSSGFAGQITCSGTTTSYATSSDYRLKENIQPMTGALAKVQALKPCTYKWKADGSDGEGFIAHELAEVVPQCVTGEKDAVDEDGNPKYQGIDTSFLVATLTAALQEAHGLIKNLQTRVDALEAK